MKPRLKTSIKKQDFPIDYIKMINQVVSQNFAKAAKEYKVVTQGYIYDEEVLIRVGFLSQSQVKQINFEASIGHSLKKKDVMDQIYVAIDALGSMMGQYFDADGDIELPKVWNEFKLDGKPVYLQFSTENSDLEAKANQILNTEEDEG